MAKVVCETCGEVIAEGVDPDEAQDIADGHSHGSAPNIADRRDGHDSDGDGSDDGGGSGGVGHHEDGPDGDAEATAEATDGNVEETTDDAPDGDADDTAEDRVEEELDEMDEMDDAREAGDWWDVSPDEDYSEVGEEFKRQFKRVQAEVEKARSDVGQRIKYRDTGIEEGWQEDYWGDTPSDDLREDERWHDLRDDIADAFRQLKSRDVPRPSRKGSALNMDAIVQRQAGDRSRDRLFTRKETAARGDRAIGVSTDFSGSMYERQARLALAAIAEATRIIGDDFTATCWATGNGRTFGKRREAATLGVITGPDEQFDWTHLDAFGVGGKTPTADGVDDMKGILEDMTAREKVMIVVTDGKPNITFGGGQDSITRDPVEDAAFKVREARQDGIKVIGLGVGNVRADTMSRIFGPNGFVSGEMDDLPQKLVEVYQQQIRA